MSESTESGGIGGTPRTGVARSLHRSEFATRFVFLLVIITVVFTITTIRSYQRQADDRRCFDQAITARSDIATRDNELASQATDSQNRLNDAFASTVSTLADRTVPSAVKKTALLTLEKVQGTERAVSAAIEKQRDADQAERAAHPLKTSC